MIVSTTDQIVLQFSTSTALASMFIRRMAHSPFSHVDMVLSDGLFGASDNPDAPVVRGNPRGVAVRPFDYQEFNIRRNAVIKTTKAPRIHDEAMTQLGKPFDVNAVSFSSFTSDEPFDRSWRDKDCWFCSELMAWSFEKANYWGRPLMWPKNRLSPTDFLLLFMFDPNFINWDGFWDQLPGIKLGARER